MLSSDSVVLDAQNHRIVPVTDTPSSSGNATLSLQESDALTQSEARLRASEAQLRDLQMRLESALFAGEVATWTYDLVNERIVADDRLAGLFSLSPEQAAGGAIGVYLQAMHPDDRAVVSDAVAKAVAGQNDYYVEYRILLPGGASRWLSARGKVRRDETGRAVSLPGVVMDITARIERERTERFLSDLTTRMRTLLDPEDVLYETAKAVCTFFNANRCLYVEVSETADTLIVRRDFVQGDGIESIAGTYPIMAFGPPVIESLRAGNITSSDDVEADPRLDEEYRATFRATNFRAFLGVPIHRAGRWEAVLAVHQAQPRVWTSDEKQLLSEVAERTWLAVENARLYRAMRDEVEQRREQGEFLRRILESTPDCIKTLSLDGKVLAMNEGGRRVMEVDDFGAV